MSARIKQPSEITSSVFHNRKLCTYVWTFPSSAASLHVDLPNPVVSRYAVFRCTSVSVDLLWVFLRFPRHRYYLVITKKTKSYKWALKEHLNITSSYFGNFFLFFVCGLFVQWNECKSLIFFPFVRKHYGVDVSFLSRSFTQIKFLYHCTSTDFFFFAYFTNILWDKKYIPMRIWPYASSSLHVMDLETMYLSRFIWIWNWRKFRLNLRYDQCCT